MGLSIARTIIEAHHGLISAKNRDHGGEIADAISDPEIERDVLTTVLTKTPNVRADRMAHLAPSGE
jgi:signal transduction histidine kinase